MTQPRAMSDDEKAAFESDLNPGSPHSGTNDGPESRRDEQEARSAFEIKALHDRFPDLKSDDLKAIPVLPAGTRLEQGATYLDLSQEPPQEVTARADMVANDSSYFVPKTGVDYGLYNVLSGITDPERTGTVE